MDTWDEDRGIPQNRRLDELSRRIVHATVAESIYRAGYTTVVVESKFEGSHSLYEVVRAITAQKLQLRKSGELPFKLERDALY